MKDIPLFVYLLGVVPFVINFDIPSKVFHSTSLLSNLNNCSRKNSNCFLRFGVPFLIHFLIGSLKKLIHLKCEQFLVGFQGIFLDYQGKGLGLGYLKSYLLKYYMEQQFYLKSRTKNFVYLLKSSTKIF
ncbi:hypothetical protein QW060_22660 [Myroides ceti]|uniref:Uncharacterized protein n=1 Tax=Paenimyroides ceti TaxID=395087 RepID=A0ABT8D2P5_9FLAO|nr:hypothetical protein [Paenimyroides ceti]MDN3709750.1 hypothetical protein [Paenimyroides ceti]